MKNTRKKKRSLKNREGTTTISFSLFPSQKIILDKVAEKQDRSISSILRKMIQSQIEQWRKEGLIEEELV